MKRQTIFAIATGAITLTLIVVLAEVVLRFAGFRPTSYRDIPGEQVVYEPDPELGWVARPGSYVLPPYDPSGAPIRMTYGPDGGRLTAPEGSAAAAAGARPQLVVVGGSFSQGWAISDDETFAWKLQQKHPSWEVKNFAVGAYGTYQSLLTLERRLPLLERPAIVLYGFIGSHEFRNVGPIAWLRTLTNVQSPDSVVMIPYASVGEDGELVRHAPEQYLKLPLRRSSALVSLVEYVTMRSRNGWTRRDRPEAVRAVSEQVLLEMKKVSEAHGARLAVVILRCDPRDTDRLMAFFEKNGIIGIDCWLAVDSEMQVPGEGHPNGEANSIWADCIDHGLADELASAP
jgi:hypothetical protein